MERYVKISFISIFSFFSVF